MKEGRVLPAEGLPLNDEEARAGRDGNYQEPVRGEGPHASAALLEPIRARTTKTRRRQKKVEKLICRSAC
jgi:hypothetical protein